MANPNRPGDTNFFDRAGMQDTKLGAMQDKDHPRDVAREGFDAMMAGKDLVVTGGGVLATASATAGAAVSVAKSLSSRYLAGVPGDAEPRNRRLAVTVNCPPERLAPGNLPEPVAKLTDRAEVSIRPAPGGRGTELAMRLFDRRLAGWVDWPPGSVARTRASGSARRCGTPSR